MPLSSFNFKLLTDPEFKEDAVREEIISPLLKHLGYSADGPAKIIRSRSLTHPFVRIGTKASEIKIIPDYLFEIDGKCRWVLDAKDPNENIYKGRNVEQAFSYSIHPEVRASVYALCNGHELIAFSINSFDPLLSVSLNDLPAVMGKIRNVLSPLAFANPALLNFKPDYGLYCLKAGVFSSVVQHFYNVPIFSITKVSESLYTVLLNTEIGCKLYAVSFDFNRSNYYKLLKSVPRETAEIIKVSLSSQPFQAILGQYTPKVDITARVGSNVITNNNESYCPLVVEDVTAP